MQLRDDKATARACFNHMKEKMCSYTWHGMPNSVYPNNQLRHVTFCMLMNWIRGSIFCFLLYNRLCRVTSTMLLSTSLNTAQSRITTPPAASSFTWPTISHPLFPSATVQNSAPTLNSCQFSPATIATWQTTGSYFRIYFFFNSN